MFRSRSFRRIALLCALTVPVPLVVTSCGGGLTGIPILDVVLLAKFVSGIVRDARTNAPIPQTKVKVTLTGGETKEGVTGTDGGFTLGDLKSGDYQFVFDALGYKQLTIDLAVTGTIDSLSVTLLPTDITTTNISITAAPPTVQLGKTAQYTAEGSSGGTPLTVFWTVEDPTVGVVNAAGKFTPLKPGTTKVYAQLGPTRFSAQVTVTDNQAAGAVFGIVTAGTNHEPVSGVTVKLGSQTVTSAPDGTFTFEEVAPGAFTVTGTKGALAGTVAGAVTVNQGTKVSLELK